MRGFLCSVLLILTVLTSASGQRLRKFSPDPQTYMTELRGFLTKEVKSKNKEEAEALLLSFQTSWNSGTIDDDEAKRIIEASNQMLKKRVNDYESWFRWLNIIMHLEDNEEQQYIIPWLEYFAKLTSDNPARISVEYLSNIYNVFYNNVLYDDGRIRWEVRTGFYEFTFEAEALFTFDGVDVWGFYKNDSTLIEATRGVFYPRTNIFKGTGGYAYFIRAGLSADSASVELRNYAFNTDKTDFEADSVVLKSLVYITEPLMGKFEEKLTSQGGRGKGTFPRFTSYRKDVFVKDMLPGADFEGGYAIIGSKFYGSGTSDKKARFTFAYEGKKKVEAQSQRFLLRQDKLSAEEVEVKIFIEEDSIYHPKLGIRYLPEIQTLSLIRSDEGMGQTPFTDSYHNMDILFEVLDWKLDEPMMKMRNLAMGTETPVVFESNNYYRGERFERLRGLDSKSPLFRLKEMTEVYGKRTVELEEVARFMRMDMRNAHIFMMQMSILGFISYDMETRQATVRDKVFDYINNFQKKRDYDVIRFVSNTPKEANATLSLLDNALEIEGVRQVFLSDSQKVGLYPYGQQIKVYEGLNFDFDGKITAGLFSYWGQEFKFNYEQFRIAMTDIDSMQFKVRSFTPNALGQRELKTVQTVLQDLTGELIIDKPNNKSGKVSYSEYPIFKSAKDSYIYYDKKSIHDGVYERQDFYVQLEPFEIDSLDNATTDGLRFDGTFTSAGIFPDLQQQIKVQPDYSLGFTTQTPPGGLAAYGKGTFNNELSLSNQGLRGNGLLEYLNSTAESEELFFYPDSTNGVSQAYEIIAQTTPAQNPHVLGKNVDIHWEPKNDVLYSSSKDQPFNMYDEVGMLATGTLAHSPMDLRGNGKINFYHAEAGSRDFVFANRDFTADSLAIAIRADDEAPVGFELTNANAVVDFNRNEGEFNINDDGEYFSFPANKYIALMDYAKWHINEKSFDIKKLGSGVASELVSVHPRQDSLRFNADRAKFYLTNTLLEAFKVPEILVADAQIIPDTGYVAIDPNADMRTLRNTAITANRTNRYHEFYGGTIDVDSRNYYSGTADYEYLDEDGTPWPIRFENIRVDTSGTTVGKASIKQEEAFYMSPFFAYYGKVKLRADTLPLYFNGNTHIESSCPSVTSDWFAFESFIDPVNIVIDLPEIDKDDRTKNLNNGIYLAADTTSGYVAFLSKRVPQVDKEMFFATGKLYYDRGLSSYIILSDARLEDENAKGNYMAFNNEACTIYGEGEMSLGSNKTQLSIRSFGTIDYNLKNDNMVMDLVMALDFPYSSDVQKSIASKMAQQQELNGANLGRKAFKVAAKELLKPKDSEEFFADIEKYGAPEELPKAFESTLFFTGVTLNWNPNAISFLSSGDIGIGGLGDNLVNKQMEGVVELQRKRRGDELYIYLEIDRSTFYYFEYKRNQISLYSSEDDVMDIIKELELKKRRTEVKGKAPFVYTIGTKGKYNRFLNRVENTE
jgi:hypothetical protein